LLLVGAAVLVAVVLHAASAGLARLTGLGRRLSLLLILLAALAAIGTGIWTAASDLAVQAQELAGQLQGAWSRLAQRLQSFTAGAQALPGSGMIGGLAQRVVSAASVTIGGLADLLIVLVLGPYFAVEPETYLRGFLRLVPAPRRERTRAILVKAAATLHDWLLGQLFAMALVGTLSGLGLWLLGVPQALVLGLIAGLCDFIPNLGPLLGLVPALVVAFGVSGWLAFYVLVLYLAIQAVESNLITPIIQRRAVDLPPGLTLTAQLVMGLLGGILGLLLAVPLAAVAMVVVKMAYVEDVLGEPAD
jgi:predicted PurR-regulated permease PerM